MCSKLECHFFAFFAFLFMKLLPINLKYLFAHHTSSVLQFLDLKAQWRSCFFCGSSETGMVHHWRLMLNWCFKIRLRIYLFSLTFECVCLLGMMIWMVVFSMVFYLMFYVIFCLILNVNTSQYGMSWCTLYFLKCFMKYDFELSWFHKE